MAHDVFISYSNRNKPVAEAVCAILEGEGIRCWIAPRDILPGADWGAAINTAIKEAKILVLVFSAPANASEQVKREASLAVSSGLAILPFRIEDVAPQGAMEYYLATPHWLDALVPPMEPHLANLCSTVKVILSRQADAAAQPLAATPAQAAGPEVSPSPLTGPTPSTGPTLSTGAPLSASPASSGQAPLLPPRPAARRWMLPLVFLFVVAAAVAGWVLHSTGIGRNSPTRGVNPGRVTGAAGTPANPPTQNPGTGGGGQNHAPGGSPDEHIRTLQVEVMRFGDLHQPGRKAFALTELGRVYQFRKNDPATAVGYYTQALNLWRQLGNKQREQEVLRDIAQCHPAGHR